MTLGEKVKFLEKLQGVLSDFNNVFMIIGGDFNIHAGPNDADVGKFSETMASVKLADMVEEYCLIDIWRNQNPHTRNYTWRRSYPLQQSRLDYIFVSAAFQLTFDISCEISAGVRSDHSVVDFVAVSTGRQRGPGLWRYNNELHETDYTFVELVRTEIARAKDGLDPYDAQCSLGVKVEMLLSRIRVLSIRRSKEIAFKLRQEESETLEYVTAMEKK